MSGAPHARLGFGGSPGTFLSRWLVGSKCLFAAVALASLIFGPKALAQVTLPNARFDIPGAISSGTAAVTSTPFDIGSINSIFDGNTNSLARTPNISPAFVQIAYSARRAVNRFRVFLSYGSSYQWWIEKADSQFDMDTRSGSYAIITPTNSMVSGTW